MSNQIQQSSPNTSSSSSMSNSNSNNKTIQSKIIFNNSSAPNSFGYKERRREAHTQAEQKRRDAIKKGYEDLQYMVPTCQQQDSISSYKLSKATILQRSIDYIQTLQKAQLKREQELKQLRKEASALSIMRNNYENMLKQQQLSQIQQGQLAGTNGSLSGEAKFQIFQAFCDNLFISFDQYVSAGDFQQLSASTFGWLEQFCRPQTLKDLCLNIMGQASYKIHAQLQHLHHQQQQQQQQQQQLHQSQATPSTSELVSLPLQGPASNQMAQQQQQHQIQNQSGPPPHLAGSLMNQR